jgi:transposase
VDALGNPIRVIITSGTVHDSKQAEPLLEGLQADFLLADRGYDSDAIVQSAVDRGMTPVIPPRKNRKVRRHYDEHLYRLRHLVENAFLKLKRWRSVCTRYAKNTSSFLAIVQIRCVFLWLI